MNKEEEKAYLNWLYIDCTKRIKCLCNAPQKSLNEDEIAEGKALGIIQFCICLSSTLRGLESRIMRFVDNCTDRRVKSALYTYIERFITNAKNEGRQKSRETKSHTKETIKMEAEIMEMDAELEKESDDFEHEVLCRKENLEIRREIHMKYRKRNRRIKEG